MKCTLAAVQQIVAWTISAPSVVVTVTFFVVMGHHVVADAASDWCYGSRAIVAALFISVRNAARRMDDGRLSALSIGRSGAPKPATDVESTYSISIFVVFVAATLGYGGASRRRVYAAGGSISASSLPSMPWAPRR